MRASDFTWMNLSAMAGKSAPLTIEFTNEPLVAQPTPTRKYSWLIASPLPHAFIHANRREPTRRESTA